MLLTPPQTVRTSMSECGQAARPSPTDRRPRVNPQRRAKVVTFFDKPPLEIGLVVGLPCHKVAWDEWDAKKFAPENNSRQGKYMSVQSENSSAAPLDVVIIGAGVSGIGCACYLAKELPEKRVAILEARSDLGGTWSLFQYPGIRSDSDLFTFGYDFRPWKSDKVLADGPAIMEYVRETAEEFGVDKKIRYNNEVVASDWDNSAGLWTLTVKRRDTGSEERIQTRWVFGATGYYDYEQGHRPEWPNEDAFAGQIIHPQFWPEDLDYAGKRVAVIGSGATAITLLPAMAGKAAHVTQIQRTPTYVMPLPSTDGFARFLKRILPEKTAFALTRGRYVLRQQYFYRFCQRFPKTARRLIRSVNKAMLPKGYPIDEHFNPPYDPWDQRLCVAPSGDYFRAISKGSASVVTGEIESFTPTGVRMKSGQEIEADIVVTATGLKIKLMSGLEPSIDGKKVDVSQRVVFKGMMVDGVPNFCFSIGYTNSSWTLKVGLLCEHLCRLLKYMDKKDYAVVTPIAPPESEMKREPIISFGAGYIQRSLDEMPRQGDRSPWQMSFNYLADKKIFRREKVAHKELRFEKAPAADAAVREAAE